MHSNYSKIIDVYVYRLLSYMKKDEGSEVNQRCQVLAYFSASVSKLMFAITVEGGPRK
jgi:hypothetical protein